MARIMKDSGVEWIGQIPEDWGTPKIVNQFDIIGSGTTPKSNEDGYYEDGTIYWIQSGDLHNRFLESTNKKITHEAFDNASALKLYEPDYLVIAMYGASIGNVSISKIRACTNQACCVLADGKNILKYIYYVISSAKDYLMYSAIGGTQPNISQNIIRDLRFPLPTLFEQRKIADFLDDKVDEINIIISKTKETIEQYKQYKNALVAKTITKGLNKSVSMKESGIEWVGEIPNNWEVHTLSQVFKQLKNKNSDLSETNLLSLSYGKIKRKDINSSDGLLPESFDGYNVIDRNDIVLRLTDLQNDHKSLRVGHVKERGIITSAYVTLRCKEDIATDYYYYFLHTFDIFKGFYGMGAGVRQGLNYEGIRSVKILSPDIKEQQEIVEYLNVKCAEIDALIAKKEAFVEEMEAYKKSLIYEYVTGKKEVV